LTVEGLMTSDETPDFGTLLAELVNRPAWHRRAACRGLGNDEFFPGRRQSTDAAKAICGVREVQAECLASALGDERTAGVWGG
jgi:hypothetical protein